MSHRFEQSRYTKCIKQTSVLSLLQGEKAVLVSACTCCHGEWRSILHSEREVKSSGRAGAEPLGGVQKNQHICGKLS